MIGAPIGNAPPTPLETYDHIFDFHWSPDPTVRARQEKLVTKALANNTYDFNRWDIIIAKVRVEFVALPGTEQGNWDAKTMTISINEKYGTKKSYPISYGAEIMQHEMGHVTDSLVLTNAKRGDILTLWCPPVPGQSTHAWDDDEYQNQVGEAFADGWAHVYSGKVIGPPRQPLYRFFRFCRRWGHHRLSREVKALIREVCE